MQQQRLMRLLPMASEHARRCVSDLPMCSCRRSLQWRSELSLFPKFYSKEQIDVGRFVIVTVWEGDYEL